jgi:hypothetical protein
MSFFTFETICGACGVLEDKAKAALKSLKKDVDSYEGCGRIPREVIRIIKLPRKKGGVKK